MKLSELSASEPLSFVAAAVRHLGSLPDDEVISLAELSAALRRQEPKSGSLLRKLSPHGCKVITAGRHKWVYGNPKAIAALRKKIASSLL